MMKRSLAISALALVVTSQASLANTTTVKCDGYMIVLSDAVALAAQSRASTAVEFQKNVCNGSADRVDVSTLSAPTSQDVYIEELDMSTRIVLIPTRESN